MFNIIGVKHDSKGEIIRFKLSDGRIVTKQEAISMVNDKNIENVIIGISKSGEKFLRSIPDEKDANNLDNLEEME